MIYETEKFKQYGINTPEFSLHGLKMYIRVVSIYDGDTIKAIVPFMGQFFKFTIRLSGIDTCEIKSKNQQNKDLALSARNRLFELVTSQKISQNDLSKKDLESLLDKHVYLVWANLLEFDKYGRLLANIYITTDSINSFSDILVSEKLAYKYTGDTKLTEEQQTDLLFQK